MANHRHHHQYLTTARLTFMYVIHLPNLVCAGWQVQAVIISSGLNETVVEWMSARPGCFLLTAFKMLRDKKNMSKNASVIIANLHF